MSKFARQLESIATGDKIIKSGNSKVTLSTQQSHNIVHEEYKLSTKFSVDFFMPHGAENKEEIVRIMKRSMVEEVFGEFRPIIIQMHTAIYDKDTTRLATLIAQLEHEMFVDGI